MTRNSKAIAVSPFSSLSTLALDETKHSFNLTESCHLVVLCLIICSMLNCFFSLSTHLTANTDSLNYTNCFFTTKPTSQRTQLSNNGCYGNRGVTAHTAHRPNNFNTSYLQFLQFFLVVQYCRNNICKKKVNIFLIEYHLFFADPNARKQNFQLILQKKGHIKLVKSKHTEINESQQFSTVHQI